MAKVTWRSIIPIILLMIPHNILSVALNMQHIYAVVLAGGNGERLWPLSRQYKPKQLLLVGKQGTLLEQTIDRICPIIPAENIWVSTTGSYKKIIERHVGKRVGEIVVEPSSRNTGPAILLVCMQLYQHDPNAIVIFVPADPFIPKEDNQLFGTYVKQALDFSAQHDYITLLGVKPTYPATGYGYIEYTYDVQSQAPYKVVKFHEKPSLVVAQDYLGMDTMLWNIGMFAGKVSTFIDEFRREAPAMYDEVVAYFKGQKPYDAVRPDSIDYAVIERSKKIYVQPVDFTWCDVGNLAVFLAIRDQYSQQDAPCISVKSENNLFDVPEDMLIAFLGVKDLCVIKKENILLVAKRELVEQVRAIVSQLKDEQLYRFL